MIDNRTLIVDALLLELAEALDIPPSKYQQAVQRYRSVGEWLESGTYPGTVGLPAIYPQGSFRLGTVVRPIREGKESDYDIDLVCELRAAKHGTSPNSIKHLVGNRLKEHGTYRSMLDDEGKRCWTLQYAEDDGIGFHVDVLPCVPDPLTSSRIEQRFALQAVALTDKDMDTGEYGWGGTNPNGYADWFAERQKVAFSRVSLLRKAQLQQRHPDVFAGIDDVPDQLVRTPLQRTIQILKRHRDIRFAGHKDEADKPISMIITTLAATAYQQENDVYSTLANLLDQIQRFHDTGVIQCVDDEWLIPNPVNPDENFADRWNEEDSKKPDAFFQWVNWVQEDIDALLNVTSSSDLDSIMRRSFGDSPGGGVARKYSGPLPGVQQPPRSLFGRVAKNLLRFDASHRQQPKWHMQATRHNVSIRAKYHRRGFRPAAFRSNCPALPKGVDLEFNSETDVPKPYTVHWQVVNTGSEAQRANQLRGEFYDSNKSSRNRKESTKYSGMHWVECFVVKNGICVARSGEFVVNIA